MKKVYENVKIIYETKNGKICKLFIEYNLDVCYNNINQTSTEIKSKRGQYNDE